LLGADIRAFLDQRRQEGISLRSLLGSWRGAVGVVFSSRDPLPGLLHLKQVAARRVRRYLRAGSRARATSTS
jgi:hypothetical protein